MHILHPWYCEKVEEEAEPGQFFRGNPWSKFYLRRMFRWRWRCSALAFGLRYSHRREQWALWEGDCGENCWVMIRYWPSDNHPKHNVFNHSNQTRKIMHRVFISFIFKLFGDSVGQVFFFLRGFLDRQLIITEKKFNRHCRKLSLLEIFFHHVPFSLMLKLLIYDVFVFETNVEGSWMAFLWDLKWKGSFAQYFNKIRQSRNWATLLS